ncbi:MAG: hypothetical protein R2932_04465 [Caldilineaceae bacterium]
MRQHILEAVAQDHTNTGQLAEREWIRVVAAGELNSATKLTALFNDIGWALCLTTSPLGEVK